MVKKRIVTILLILILFFLPLFCVIGFLVGTPTVYHNTFLAELSNKYERLYTIEEEKVVVIGGSSVAFGLNSQQLEQSIGMPVVNFGLYASLGSKVMLDLSRDAIRPGDIVVLAFEIDNQTLSKYFNADSMWQAVDCDLRLLGGISTDDYGKMFGSLYNYIKNKIGFLKNGAPDPEGIYNIDSFDEFGDINYLRDTNVMSVGFDPNQRICFDEINLDDDFIAYVNDYIDYVQRKGAKICLSFCPMNKMAIEEKCITSKQDFVSRLNAAFRAPYVGDIQHYIYEAQYFYDTNFHLNDYGSFLHTQQLARDLAAHCNLTYTELQPPVDNNGNSSAEDTDVENVIGAEFEDHFIYEDYYGMGWAISGVTEKAENCSEIEIPVYYDDKKILAILPGAFEGCKALEIITIIRDEKDPLTLFDGAFSNVSTLQKVVLRARPDSIKIGTEGLLIGASEGLYFYVDKQNFASYVTDYYWSIYAEKTKIIAK